MNKDNERLHRVVDILSDTTSVENMVNPSREQSLPSLSSLKKIVQLTKSVVFPGYFDMAPVGDGMRKFSIGVAIDNLYCELKTQISSGLEFDPNISASKAQQMALGLAMDFIEQIPEIKRLLYTDVNAMFDNDPAVVSHGEIILCYPVLQAMSNYRIAHCLLKMGVPIIPRIISEMAHSRTGIDIHPGAQIGEYFSIDHGTGVVIGETCIIGNHVNLYQGVTLGAKNFTLDENGHPMNLPRHPIIEDHVTIYSNASVLGRITIGHDSIIGGNVWITHDVPPHSKISQGRLNDAPSQKNV